ncbi:unnamed protein product [Fraxinus pennsylvanica]|uniref:J domain-containing protein n=1 Tax=Fraxinus pennsylvanica TaxID=56036 RepID=A0AAD2EBW4_9LAMI|nr:unnamed protein product [Fraxinus pennsylvanica]
MEPNIDEALRAKTNAEKKFAENDFVGARDYAEKAQKLCPQLEGIPQMVATYGVYIASEKKINGEFDFYSILGLDPSVDKSKLKKQYKKMAVLLHPDKNKTVGADGAFRLVSEAWTLLSDSVKRSSYDYRRNLFTGQNVGAGVYDSYSKFSASHRRLDTFWTVCTSCHVQYEYLRKYANKRLSCKNCRGVFVAVETGLAPVDGSFSYGSWSYVPESGYGNHGCGATYIPMTTGYCAPNGVSGHHMGHGSECLSNISFQCNSSSGKSVGIVDPNGLATSSLVFYQSSGKVNKTKPNGKHRVVEAAVHMVSNACTGSNGISGSKRGRPAKKRKVDSGSICASGHEDLPPKSATEVKMANGNGNLDPNSKLPFPSETSIKRSAVSPASDARQLLIDKARSEIREKLEEIRLNSEAEVAEAEKRRAHAKVDKSCEAAIISGSIGTGHLAELKRVVSMSITVPDSDFHDFDKDRSEECFKPKQIWALYDEDGFTKSCGNFRAFNSEIIEQVNIFSHVLSREKAGRGGCVRIYPRSGDIWAVYRNWSPDWNRKTPNDVRHQYEMVEVLDNYSEDHGVWVTPLVKLDGFKTVYQRNMSKEAIRWIPRKEMLRFSHQVPSCLLKVEGTSLPEGCWDLDPAATPEELLQVEPEVCNNVSPGQTEKRVDALDENRIAEFERQAVEKLSQMKSLTSSPVWHGVVGNAFEASSD